MEAAKIFAVVLERPGLSAKEIAELCGANSNTVQSVLKRYERAIAAEKPSHHRGQGRPALVYTARTEWTEFLRQKATPSPTREAPLESALDTLESASFAAVDPLESVSEKLRMKELARLYAKAATALLTTANSEAERRLAEARIAKALARLEARAEPHVPIATHDDTVLQHGFLRTLAGQFRPAPKTFPPAVHWIETSSEVFPPCPKLGQPPEPMYRAWADKLGYLAAVCGVETPQEASYDSDGIVLLIDCVKGDQVPIERNLVMELKRHHHRLLAVPLADLAYQERDVFMQGFQELALDPAARGAYLIVTVDSNDEKSTETWREITGAGDVRRLSEALRIARSSVRELAIPATEPGEQDPFSGYCMDFIDEIWCSAASQGTLWPALGQPVVVDMADNDAVKDLAEGQRWSYHGAPSGKAIGEIVNEATGSIIQSRQRAGLIHE